MCWLHEYSKLRLAKSACSTDIALSKFISTRRFRRGLISYSMESAASMLAGGQKQVGMIMEYNEIAACHVVWLRAASRPGAGKITSVRRDQYINAADTIRYLDNHSNSNRSWLASEKNTLIARKKRRLYDSRRR